MHIETPWCFSKVKDAIFYSQKSANLASLRDVFLSERVTLFKASAGPPTIGDQVGSRIESPGGFKGRG